MHDVLRQRLLRRIESLPEEQIYQVLDYIEFLESKYARDLQREATGLQRFAEGLEDQLRRRAVSPATLREAFQLISSADRILSGVAKTGKEILGELGEPAPGGIGGERRVPPGSDSRGRAPRDEGRPARAEEGGDSPSGARPDGA
jgi:hypothetical protein